jgi:predicted ABC-type ATPase
LRDHLRVSTTSATLVALVLAGPNGAGKTTSSRLLVPPGSVFLNADDFAARLAAGGHQPAGLDMAAGRALLGEMRRLVDDGDPFCLETNLAGRGLVRSISTWRRAGYRVGLAFIALRSPELALARVATRVALGGHDVPEAVVRRRWRVGLEALFDVYLEVVDEWWLMDNSDDLVVLVARGGRSQGTEIYDRTLWNRLQGLAKGTL